MPINGTPRKFKYWPRLNFRIFKEQNNRLIVFDILQIFPCGNNYKEEIHNRDTGVTSDILEYALGEQQNLIAYPSMMSSNGDLTDF